MGSTNCDEAFREVYRILRPCIEQDTDVHFPPRISGTMSDFMLSGGAAPAGTYGTSAPSTVPMGSMVYECDTPGSDVFPPNFPGARDDFLDRMDTAPTNLATYGLKTPSHPSEIYMDQPVPWDRYQQFKPCVEPGNYHLPSEFPLSIDEMDDILRSLDEVLAHTQGMALPVAGVSHSEAFANVLQVGNHEELVCRTTVAEPGQAPGNAVNDVARQRPHLKFPSENRSAKASGGHKEKVLNKVSAGTTLMAASKLPVYATESNKAQRKRCVRAKLGAKPKCDACNEYFNCEKDRKRHLTKTKVHNAPVVARCSCGKTVTRKDAMRIHRKYCPRGTTEEPEA